MENARYPKLEFDEAQFISDAEAAQEKLLSGARQYLFDLKAHAGELAGEQARYAALSADSLESAINSAQDGSVLYAGAYLGDAKYFYIGIPADIADGIMKAAKLMGLRNFVRCVHVSEAP